MTTTEQSIRDYLVGRYDAERVATGCEIDADDSGLYYGEPDSWLVLGTLPNTNERGWFFAGTTDDILREMECR